MDSIVNSSLHNSYCLYTKDALSIMRADYRKNGVTIINQHHWIRDSSGDYRRVQKQVPFWSICMYRIENQLKSIGSYQALVSHLSKDPVISTQLDTTVGTFWSQSIVRKDAVVNLAALRLAEKRNLRYYQPLVTRTYREIEEFFHSTGIRHEVIVPLDGLSLETDELKLDEHVSICKMPEKKILWLLNMNIQLGHVFDNFTHDLTEFAVRVRYDSKKYLGTSPKVKYDPERDDRIQYARMANHAVDVLRIAKPGTFFKLGTFQFGESPFGMGASYRVDRLPHFHTKDGYRILKKDGVQLRKLWKTIDTKGVRKRRFLTNAIHRFSTAVEKDILEDKLIDLMIAAESLFLNDEKYQGELRYRFSHRVVLFHEKLKPERMKLFKVMKGIYDIRSQILHGASEKYKYVKKEDNSFYNLADYCDILTEILRKAIQKMIIISQDTGASKSLIDWDDVSF